jgi:hypothetical protein
MRSFCSARPPVCLLLAAATSLACVEPPKRRPVRDAGTSMESGGSSGTAGSGGSGGSGGFGGSGGSFAGSGGSGGGGSGGGSVDAQRDPVDAGRDTGSPSDGPTASPTFATVFTQILSPGCTAPNNACHSVLRSQYFIFAPNAQMRSYMLLVPTPAQAGAIPARVMRLLTHVTPTNPAVPTSVSMPPQSGPRLGNPPVMKPPLTADQLGTLRAWATSGAKYE